MNWVELSRVESGSNSSLVGSVQFGGASLSQRVPSTHTKQTKRIEASNKLMKERIYQSGNTEKKSGLMNVHCAVMARPSDGDHQKV